MEGKRRVLCPSSARAWGTGREQACCPAAGACSKKPACSAKPQLQGEMLEGCLLQNTAGEVSRLPYLSCAVVRRPRLDSSVPSKFGLGSHGVDGSPSFVGIHLDLWECGGTWSLRERQGPCWAQICRFLLPESPRGLHASASTEKGCGRPGTMSAVAQSVPLQRGAFSRAAGR